VQEALAELARAPVWAQLMIALFVLMTLAGAIVPSMSTWRHRRRFEVIAADLGQSATRADNGRHSLALTVEGRSFDVMLSYRGSGAQSSAASYRGPRGDLLELATVLRGNGWSMHQADIARVRKLADAISGTTPTPSGDAEFDESFRVLEDGLPFRQRWLDAPTRDAIRALFDVLPPHAIVWLREGHLVTIVPTPWTGVDGPAVRVILQRQAALGSSLERR
jgi:hypothetical protein